MTGYLVKGKEVEAKRKKNSQLSKPKQTRMSAHTRAYKLTQVPTSHSRSYHTMVREYDMLDGCIRHFLESYVEVKNLGLWKLKP